ncbi:MAG: hypothetical protein JSW51_13465 [Gemmatimonadota bacterium]|nr:MAG: hypothetical protein JSW51_13465 [Gemmatimonadota bacterium]
MNRFGALTGGVVAGSIGALLWAAIAYFTGYEVGWVAWGVGGLVGFGVVLGSGGHKSQAIGVLAVVVTVLALVAAKYTTVQLILSDGSELAEALVSGLEEDGEGLVASLEDDELVVSYIADEVVIEFMSEDRTVTWPAGVDPSQASTEVEYPADVWAVAQSRWDAMSLTEREEYRNGLREMVTANLALALEEVRGEMARVGFIGSFGLMDLIFFGLAIATAYKVAANTAPETHVTQQPEELQPESEARVA